MKVKRAKTGVMSLFLVATVVTAVTGCGTSSNTSGQSTTSAKTNNAAQSSSSANATSSSSQSLVSQAKKAFPHGVTLLVGFSTGGGVDTSARVLQPYLQKVLGVPVVVQNMTGGGGLVASNYLYKQSADSSDIMMAYTQTLSLEEHLKTVKYKTTNFTALNGVYGNDAKVLIVGPKSPYSTLSDLKNAHKTLTIGISGIGNTPWLAAAYLAEINHLKVQVVPFSSGGKALTAVMGGSVDMTISSTPVAVRALKDKTAKPIIQMGPKRVPALPNVPTIQQSGGTSDESFDTEIGLFGPPKMNSKNAQILETAILEAEKDPQFVAKAKSVGLSPVDENASQWKSTVDSFDSKINSQVSMLKTFLKQK